jgi:hypothetical protein
VDTGQRFSSAARAFTAKKNKKASGSLSDRLMPERVLRRSSRLLDCSLEYILAAQHVRQLVFTHRLGQRQASVRLVKNS